MKTDYEECIEEIAVKLKNGEHVNCLIDGNIEFLCVAYVADEAKPYRGLSYNISGEQLSVVPDTVELVLPLGEMFEQLMLHDFVPDCFGYWHSKESSVIFSPEMWITCGDIVNVNKEYEDWMIKCVDV